MTSRDFDLEITQVNQALRVYVEAQRSVLEQKLKRLTEARTAVRDSSTNEELAAAVDRASEDLELYSKELRENFLNFEEELFQLEEGILDGLVEDKWSKHTEAPDPAEMMSSAEETVVAPAGKTAPPDTAELNYRAQIADLYDFISPHQRDLPSLKKCRERLRQAESLQAQLHARWLVESARAVTTEQEATADALFEETAELETVIREIQFLITFIKQLAKDSKRTKPGTPPPHSRTEECTSQVIRKTRNPRPSHSCAPSPSGSAEIVPGPVEDSSESLREISTEQLRKYEEDYLDYRALFIHLRKTAQTPEEIRNALELGNLLQNRRSQLEQWRANGTWPSNPPPMINEVFSATSPDETTTGVGVGERQTNNQKKTKRERRMARQIRDILRDLSENPGDPQTAISSLGNVNGRVFLTSGRVNPRAKS